MSVNIIAIGNGFYGDAAAEFTALVERDVACSDILEGLSGAELKDLGPCPGTPIFMTRSPVTGEEIALAKSAVGSRLADFLRGNPAQVGGFNLLWCTGRFDLDVVPNNLLFPADIVLSAIRNTLRVGVLGVLMPLAEQRAQMEAKWCGQGFNIVTAAVLPGAPTERIEQAARELARYRPSLVVMDCMIYGRSAKQTVKQIVRAPVILPSTLCARVIGELL